jgi:phosphoribosylamine--glycine ligase
MIGVRVLIIGGGGREHAIAWALKRSPAVLALYAAPGNAGTFAIADNVPIPAEDVGQLVHFAVAEHMDLVVVGPEAPLAAGLVDALAAAGIPAFGPTQAAAQLEASKAYAKAFMQEHEIPTAAYADFTDPDAALAYIDSVDHQVVVKADGLAAGKGVIVCADREQARTAVKVMLRDGAFGTAGGRVVIEERLEGPELSVLAFCDGKTVAIMPPARDHKRAYDNDQGPNTGGMGAFAPAPGVDADLLEFVRCDVIQRAVDGMAARGTPYQGVLYAGLILTADGPRVLEFNCRFGDPETQVILPLLDTDLLAIMLACVDGTLDQIGVRWKPDFCATVVAASGGYPGKYASGLQIVGLADVRDAVVFHAGTRAELDGRVMTAGGRVLAVSGLGVDLDSALQRAYAGMQHINFEGMHFRRDIGRTR